MVERKTLIGIGVVAGALILFSGDKIRQIGGGGGGTPVILNVKKSAQDSSAPLGQTSTQPTIIFESTQPLSSDISGGGDSKKQTALPGRTGRVGPAPGQKTIERPGIGTSILAEKKAQSTASKILEVTGVGQGFGGLFGRVGSILGSIF